MVSEQKTLVILDTNKIRNNFEWEKDYSAFEPKGDFLKIIDFVEDNKLEDMIFIGIPEIVLEELVNTRCENFNNELIRVKEGIKKLGNVPCFDFSKIVLPSEDYNYNTFIKSKIEDYFENKKFIVVLKLERELYDRTLELLIKKATQKQKPFGESKKGFKDALIWEIILNLKNVDRYYSLYVLSENEKDFDFDLKDEFKKKFSKNLNLEFNTTSLIVTLENIYDLHIKYPKILAYLKTQYFKEQLETLLVENYSLEINNFEIRNIVEIEPVIKDDLQKFAIEDSFSEEDSKDFLKISMIFVNTDKEHKIDFIFEQETNEIIASIIEYKASADE